MRRKILFLRPFWDTDLSVKQLKIIYKQTERFGKLIAIRNGPEETSLEKSFNIKLVKATDDTWKKKSMKQISKADMIITHIAPKSGPENALGNIQHNPIIQEKYDKDFISNPVQESGTGRGLLREIDYCRQQNALSRTIALVPNSLYHRIKQALEIIELTASGQMYRFVEGGIQASTPRLSMLDRALKNLEYVHAIVFYRKFGDLIFNYHFRQSLSSLIKSQEKYHKARLFSIFTRLSAVFTKDIPGRPVELPPDGMKKNIRFTPISSLTSIPKGRIVELSFNEVQEIVPSLKNGSVKCPRCGKGPKSMFWYQFRSSPSLNATPYMRCQYCGNDEYLQR